MLIRYILRALCALLVGFLLVNNPTDMTILIVQIIGGLFALSGVVAIVGYFISRQQTRRAEKRAAKMLAENADATIEDIHSTSLTPVFPVVGIGSLAFGAFLLCFPAQFVNYLMYVLGGLLVLIGAWQVVTLITYRKIAPLGWTLFILPILNLVAGVVVICYPMETVAMSFTILGIGYILYGISEFFFGVRYYHFRRIIEAEQRRLQEIAEAELREAEAREAEAEEVEVES